MTVEATQDADFAEVVNGADWVATDGVPITWALNMQYGIEQDRIAGFDIMSDLIRRAAEEQLPILFYGSTPDVLNVAVANCRELHPTIRIAGTFSPPFRPLTAAEEEAMISFINQSGARLVFVALGCPKQERWMAHMRGKIQAVMIGIGGALPLLAGTQGRSPAWMRNAGLEWTYRLAMEPRRLFKRYAITNSFFVFRLTKELLGR
ncbi:WecB/TagA/CpsF family glycosyltransferase [Spirosoma utsteinense]|uniref:N-acetylglucosaminyldiphosphoundecaprenol N-acetyl-beta-D-mannosaminyltransferase n=1 Tax=Spirosoma utsteinense TaxID=2585773 RepID=A0ABR6WDN3_9BACT|nr:WecB/TagA/CpsF family glycosyltransferase [Spirosoma utsteinense]MBC3788256.1 N-acetylglucosaminyldiphosphoundecaprenol N-acetyl-beta-D-mannosaminyltransferase [Spirosoma utsteinense]MBC3794669.1 N-acetylglucosaminyldiphosphoundecaprenol N-acetyl-beta-D-mannosaminyltransferase [Spirosoma utsteinense]